MSKKIKIKVVLFSGIFYLSLITGFYFNESLNGGAYGDWVSSSAVIKDFEINFLDTLNLIESVVIKITASVITLTVTNE